MLVIGGVAVLLLLIEEAVPYLRGVVVLVEDREMTNGRNVRISCLIKTFSLYSFNSLTKFDILYSTVTFVHVSVFKLTFGKSFECTI